MRKIELYEFKYGDQVWFFTTQGKQVVWQDEVEITYLPKVIGRSDIVDEDIDKSSVDITFNFPDDNSLQDLLKDKIYFNGVTVTILEYWQSTETPAEWGKFVIFKGRVVLPKFDKTTMTLSCETSETKARKNILTRKYSRNCTNKIYDKFCGLNFDDFAVDAKVVSIDSNPNVIFLATYDENEAPVAIDDFYYNRGIMLKDGIYTFIMQNIGGTFTLYRPHKGLQGNDIVRIAPGCNQTFEVCRDKFENSKNFMGFPFIPVENPMNREIMR